MRAFIPLILFCLTAVGTISSQSVIDIDLSGNSYTAIDDTIVNNYDMIDISNCYKFQISCDFQFSLPWEGSGNIESSDECSFGAPCLGDPDQPFQGNCTECWDFMRFEVFLSNNQVIDHPIGGVGTTNADQSGSFLSSEICTDGQTQCAVKLTNQNWSANETNTYSNLTLICFEGSNTNSFTGTLDNSWTTPDNWSLGVVPDACQHVIIGPGQNAVLANGEYGECYTIDVQQDGEMHVQPGAELFVITDAE